jgi:3-hydroxy-3-methylglutaryl CoA synthase
MALPPVVSILAAAGALPRARLSRAEMAKVGLPAPGGVESRAVAARDEDAVTLAVEAALRLDAGAPDLLLFATSLPGERPATPLLVEALGLPEGTRSAELSGPRAGTSALLLASLAAGRAERALLLAADAPLAAPGSETDGGLGAGGAALLLGPGGGLARLEGSSCRTEETVPSRVSDGGVVRETSIPPVPRAELEGLVGGSVRALLEAGKLKPADVSRVFLQAPDPKAAQRLGRGLGFTDAQMGALGLAAEIGDAGCAAPLLGLLKGLEGSRTGDRLVAASYAPGGGSDALLFRVEAPPKGPLLDAGRTRPIDGPTYLRWRGVI